MGQISVTVGGGGIKNLPNMCYIKYERSLIFHACNMSCKCLPPPSKPNDVINESPRSAFGEYKSLYSADLNTECTKSGNMDNLVSGILMVGNAKSRLKVSIWDIFGHLGPLFRSWLEYRTRMSEFQTKIMLFRIF